MRHERLRSLLFCRPQYRVGDAYVIAREQKGTLEECAFGVVLVGQLVEQMA
jgi:hypothetical protein